jgi:hypothetical protein
MESFTKLWITIFRQAARGEQQQKARVCFIAYTLSTTKLEIRAK